MYCAIKESTGKIAAASKDILREMSRLGREMKRCKKCPQRAICELVYQFNSVVNNAIGELVDEWRERGQAGISTAQSTVNPGRARKAANSAIGELVDERQAREQAV